MYELAILGGGPAGVSAGVYAARKKLKTILITKNFEGQSVVSSNIENWIGEINISGHDLAQKMEHHLKKYSNDLDIKEKYTIEKIEKKENYFEIKTDKENFQAKAILVATGSVRKKIQAKNSEKFENKGIVYCASCDGPLFTEKDVVVIGGGNAGFESANQLLAYTKSVTLLHYKNTLKADPVTVENLKKNKKFKLILNAEVKEIIGNQFVNGLIYIDKNTEKEVTLKTDGIFVEIGATPAVSFIKEIVPTDESGKIKIDPWTQKTETEGIWAAGDCTNIKYYQNNIAVGDAIKALEDIYIYIKTRTRKYI